MLLRNPDFPASFDLLAAIDVRGGQVVRLQQGDFARETAYADDPVAVAVAFAAAGAPWLHVVDLDGASDPAHRQVDLIAAIVAGVGERAMVEVAGGLRDADAVGDVLRAGAARVAVGTAALADPRFAGRLVADHGAERIAVALDVRDGRAVGHGWRTSTPGIPVEEALLTLADAGVAAFEVTAIERDGTLAGPDLELLGRLVALRRGAVVASAGIAGPEDLRAVRRLGCAGAIVGRALYDGSLDLAAALAAVTVT
jgi:phosphoribosylformimino-5-aminoimidazole carboxamide ribotide isomerase